MPVGDDSGALWADVHEAVQDFLATERMSHLEQLGIEYVEALRSAQALREQAEEGPFSTLKSGRVVIHPGFEAADRDMRRAIQLAKALDLNKARVAPSEDPFAELETEVASLAEQRKRRGKQRGKAKPA